MDIISVMDAVCLVVTLLMFLSGVPPCVQMYRTNSTENVPFVFFLLNIISCLGMFHYGLLTENGTITFLNGVGSILQIVYTLTFLYVAKFQGKYMRLLLLASIYELGLYWYVFNVIDSSQIAATIGLCSSSIITVIATMPAIELVDNFRNKNSHGMPFVMLVGGFMCSLSWLVYGLLLQDANVYRPNIPGLVIMSLKILAVQLYADRSPVQPIEKKVD